MSELEIIYADTKTQSTEKGIVDFKGDRLKWVQEKRRQRRRGRKSLKNASKNDVCTDRCV